MQDAKKISNEVSAITEKIEYQKKYIGSLQDQLKNIDDEIQKLNMKKLNDASNVDLKNEIDKKLEDRYKIDKMLPVEEKTLQSLESELNTLKEMQKIAEIEANKKEFDRLGVKRHELNKTIVQATETILEAYEEIVELDKHQRNAIRKAKIKLPNRLYKQVLENYIGWKLPFLSMPNTPKHNRGDLNDLDIFAVKKDKVKI